MCKKMMFFMCVVLVLGLVGSAGAKVYLPCDVGGCSDPLRIQPGWINIPGCGLYADLAGTDVDVELIQVGNECACRGYFDEYTSDPPCDCVGCCPASGPLGDVEQEFLFGDDQHGPPGGNFRLVFSDLVVGAPYKLTSFHNRLDEPSYVIPRITVSGATNVSAPTNIPQGHEMFVDPSKAPVTSFTPTSSTVSVEFIAPSPDSCPKKCASVFMNGFILEGGLSDIQFESAWSGALESVSPAVLNVVLSDVQTQVVTVDYAVTGGTAANGVDYTLEDGTLTFDVGETLKQITIPIVDDAEDESDETIEVTLSNVTGTNMELGQTAQHTYTIIDPRPAVSFDMETSSKTEDESPLEITVSLSESSAGHVVRVAYAVVGGTAIGGGVDYVLDPGTLLFYPGQTSKTIIMELVDDALYERDHDETVVVKLISAVHAKLGDITEHTAYIVDPWAKVAFPMLKVDLGCPGNPDTLKPGWVPWEIANGCDGQPHDGRGISNIAGTGVDAYICLEGDTGGGNLRQGAGEPICNTFYTYYTFTPQGVGVELRLSGSGLVPGEYWLYGYHNSIAGVMPSITATGEGVIQIEPVTDVPVQSVSSDLDLVPSLIKFFTNGAGPVSILYESPPGSNAFVNAFELHNTLTPPWATNPTPQNNARDMAPDVVLSWEAGLKAGAHEVYLGVDFNDVNDATDPDVLPGRGRQVETSYAPGLLEFSRYYYWRVDEVNELDPESPWKGQVWTFTTDSGKARSPTPADPGSALTQVLLKWTAGTVATSHDVYFGDDEAAVSNATTASSEYKGNRGVCSYNPGTLQDGASYYWRIDEIGEGTYVKGDVWTFKTVGTIDLKVDLALPREGSADYSNPWPESAKPGWNIWAQPRWADMYGHDAVLNDGSGLERGCGDPFNGPGIGGSGVMAGMTCVYEGRGGLKLAGLEMCSLNASGCTGPLVSGTPLYEPICNTWFQITDYPGLPGSIILLPLYNLPAGEYQLTSYHNNFGGERNDGRPHWECVCNPQWPMNSITVAPVAIAERLFPGSGSYEWQKLKGNYDLGNPDGVELIQGAYNVEIQQVTHDAELNPSVIKFRTDGSAVLVMYEGTCCVPDDIRPARESARAILNAFELKLLESPCLCPGDLAGTDGFSAPEGKIDTGDMAKLLSELITGGGGPEDNYKVQNPSALLLSCGDLADTAGFGPPDGQIDTGDMAKLLSHLIIDGNPDRDYECGCTELP